MENSVTPVWSTLEVGVPSAPLSELAVEDRAEASLEWVFSCSLLFGSSASVEVFSVAFWTRLSRDKVSQVMTCAVGAWICVPAVMELRRCGINS